MPPERPRKALTAPTSGEGGGKGLCPHEHPWTASPASLLERGGQGGEQRGSSCERSEGSFRELLSGLLAQRPDYNMHIKTHRQDLQGWVPPPELPSHPVLWMHLCTHTHCQTLLFLLPWSWNLGSSDGRITPLCTSNSRAKNHRTLATPLNFRFSVVFIFCINSVGVFLLFLTYFL